MLARVVGADRVDRADSRNTCLGDAADASSEESTAYEAMPREDDANVGAGEA